ncbi:MAG: hypothetical protein QOJ88_1562 [Pyrinomonadaceae bacterium]|jgi:hypothetical protein|nr:hypothetical protein [Pyrinomonadaceae bacterium]
MTLSMSGLRVYVNAPGGDSIPAVVESVTEAGKVFYSRRGNGPTYRWSYEAKLAHWRAARMHTSDVDAHKLSNASWKSVPESLQAQLGAHYLD